MKPAVVRDVSDMKLLLRKLDWVVKGIKRSCFSSGATPDNSASIYIYLIYSKHTKNEAQDAILSAKFYLAYNLLRGSLQYILPIAHMPII